MDDDDDILNSIDASSFTFGYQPPTKLPLIGIVIVPPIPWKIHRN